MQDALTHDTGTCCIVLHGRYVAKSIHSLHQLGHRTRCADLRWNIGNINNIILRYTVTCLCSQNTMQRQHLVAVVTNIIMVFAPLPAIPNMSRSLTAVAAKVSTAVQVYAMQSTKGTSCFNIMSGNIRC